MKTSSSMALVPVGAKAVPARAELVEVECCGSAGRSLSRRNKWLLAAAAALVTGGLAVGSKWLSLASILPLLYTLPCLLVVAMCMKMQGKGGGANNNKAL